jgi:hypothetical protein
VRSSEVRDVFPARGVRYLFVGKSGAIRLGFPDTRRTPTTARRVVVE